MNGTASSSASASLAIRLRAFLVAHFSRNELELLCLDLHVDPEDVPGIGAGKEYWAAQIVLYFQRRDALLELIRRCKELRPGVPWDELDAALPQAEAAGRSLPRLVIAYAEPLAYRSDGQAEPIERLDFAKERERLMEALRDAGRAIAVEVTPCTADAFRRALTLGCRALHYSGHGHPDFLAFEDDEAGLQPLSVAQLRDLLSAGGAPDVRLAFVSACHSRRAGEAFVQASVPHVVAVRVEAPVLDDAAREFARHFYLALLAGKTVGQAFEIGQSYVRALPDVQDEADKFLLLPEGGNHAQVIFGDAPTGELQDLTPPLPPENLPAPPERLVGRNALLQQIIAEVLHSRLVTLRGAPGIGKSSLAVAAAHYLRDRRKFRDGVFFISLRNAVSTEQLRAAMADALGLVEVKSDAQLFAALRDRRCLFVLDNAEDALNADFAPQFRRFVRDLLQQGRDVRLLVTSRQALGGGLPGVAERVIKPPPLDPRSAAQLLLALAPDPDRLIAELSASGITTLDALARHPLLKALAGNPFAIALAAPLLESKTLAEVSALIEAQPADALAVQGVPDDERDETMSLAKSLAVSYGHVQRRDPQAARLFGLMGLLPGGALEADLDAIWGAGWLPHMDELVNKSLVEREASAFGAQYYTFPLVTAYAERQLSDADRRDFALRIADHMSALSHFIHDRMGQEEAALARALFALHEDNLLACLSTARPARAKHENEPASPVGIIASYLPQILLRAYRLDDALQATERGLAACRAVGDRLGEANVLQAIGDVQQFRDERDAALASYAQALDLFRAVGDRLGEANVLKAIGDVQQFRDERDAALASYAQALDLFRAVGAKLGEANVLQAIGDVQQFRKETNAALASYAQALDLFRAVGAKLGEANVLQAIGDVQQFRDERDAALASYAQALDLFRAVGAKLGEANVYLAIGRLQGEAELFERAITLYRQIGDAYSTARGQYFFALLLLERGEADRAIECLSEARQIWAQMGFEPGVQAVDQALARAAEQAAPLVAAIPESLRPHVAAFGQALLAAQANEGDANLWQAAAEKGEALLAALESAPPIPALGVEDMRAQLAEVYNVLGNALNESDKTQSLAAYDRAIALLPDEAMLHRNRAGTLIELGRLDEAAAAIETARRLEPDAPRLAELDAQLAAARGAQDRT